MTNDLVTKKKLFYNLIIDGASGILAYKLADFLSLDFCKIILIGRSQKKDYKRKDILKKINIDYYSDYSLIPKKDTQGSVFVHTASSTPNNNNLGDKDIFVKNLELRNRVTEHIFKAEYKLIINISSMSV